MDRTAVAKELVKLAKAMVVARGGDFVETLDDMIDAVKERLVAEADSEPEDATDPDIINKMKEIMINLKAARKMSHAIVIDRYVGMFHR